MIGVATGLREARIALDVGQERTHFKNPYLPHTRSEMALPLAVGSQVLGAVTVQSVEERAFSEDDILTLQTMADHLAVAINNAITLKELEKANKELLRTKTFEALTTATTQAIHWIGNKALPMTTTIARMKQDVKAGKIDPASFTEDLDLLEESARLIVQVKENLIGPAREQKPRASQLVDVAQTAARHAGVPSNKITVNIIGNIPLALADTTQLARALGNLFRNALEADAKHIIINIRAASEPNFVELEIVDDGAGISKEMLDKMWAAFVTTKGAGHSGLGLTAALHVITQLEGRVTAESQPGKGTTFHILLPVAPATDAGDLSGGPQSIMLIDDDDQWSQAAVKTLQAAGKNVWRQAIIEDAANADLILVDDAIGEDELTNLLTTLQISGIAKKVIVLSAAPTVERTTAYLNAGVKDVALKPYTPQEWKTILK
jgi:signal transduction histidine kinase/CheY-like chemotaxis protein